MGQSIRHSIIIVRAFSSLWLHGGFNGPKGRLARTALAWRSVGKRVHGEVKMDMNMQFVCVVACRISVGRPDFH